MTRADVAVLISGRGSNLGALLDAAARPGASFRIAVVLSNRDTAEGLALAHQAGVPTEVLPHGDYASRDAFDQALMARIDQHSPALIVLAGYMRILGNAFVDHYEGRLLNIHPSLLPKHTGLDTHSRALAAGDSEHGCSVHFVTRQLDGGPLVLQGRLTIRPGESVQALAERVLHVEHRLYPQAVDWFARGRLRLTDHGPELDGQLLPPEGLVTTEDNL